MEFSWRCQQLCWEFAAPAVTQGNHPLSFKMMGWIKKSQRELNMQSLDTVYTESFSETISTVRFFLCYFSHVPSSGNLSHKLGSLAKLLEFREWSLPRLWVLSPWNFGSGPVLYIWHLSLWGTLFKRSRTLAEFVYRLELDCMTIPRLAIPAFDETGSIQHHSFLPLQFLVPPALEYPEMWGTNHGWVFSTVWGMGLAGIPCHPSIPLYRGHHLAAASAGFQGCFVPEWNGNGKSLQKILKINSEIYLPTS